MLSSMPRKIQFLKNLQRFRLVTFDITDTLLKFRKPPSEHYACTAADSGLKNINKRDIEVCFRQQFKIMLNNHPNFGYNTPKMTWQSWWIQLVENTFRCVAPTATPEQILLIAETLLKQYRTKECWDHIDGGRDLIQKLRDSGKYVGVISNFDPSLRVVLQEMNIDDKFDLILNSYEAGVQKPNPRIFQIPLEHFKVSAEESLHIGNIYDIDYLGARNSGWSSLLISKDIRNLGYVKTTHVFTSLTAMLEALETTDIIW